MERREGRDRRLGMDISRPRGSCLALCILGREGSRPTVSSSSSSLERIGLLLLEKGGEQ